MRMAVVSDLMARSGPYLDDRQALAGCLFRLAFHTRARVHHADRRNAVPSEGPEELLGRLLMSTRSSETRPARLPGRSSTVIATVRSTCAAAEMAPRPIATAINVLVVALRNGRSTPSIARSAYSPAPARRTTSTPLMRSTSATADRMAPSKLGAFRSKSRYCTPSVRPTSASSHPASNRASMTSSAWRSGPSMIRVNW